MQVIALIKKPEFQGRDLTERQMDLFLQDVRYALETKVSRFDGEFWFEVRVEDVKSPRFKKGYDKQRDIYLEEFRALNQRQLAAAVKFAEMMLEKFFELVGK